MRYRLILIKLTVLYKKHLDFPMIQISGLMKVSSLEGRLNHSQNLQILISEISSSIFFTCLCQEFNLDYYKWIFARVGWWVFMIGEPPISLALPPSL